MEQEYEETPNYVHDNQPMSIGDWLITILVLSIPCVNMIMFFVWMFVGNRNRRNLLIAYFILIFIVIAIYLVLVFFFGVTTYLLDPSYYQ